MNELPTSGLGKGNYQILGMYFVSIILLALYGGNNGKYDLTDISQDNIVNNGIIIVILLGNLLVGKHQHIVNLFSSDYNYQHIVNYFMI